MILTEDDATKVLHSILDVLRASTATEVLDGIDESRRLGIEEVLPEKKEAEMKQVSRTRRRPVSDAEMVTIVLERLYQRLIVLPSLGAAIKKRLGVEDVLWQVDREFVSTDRFPEAQLSDFSAPNVFPVTVQRSKSITTALSDSATSFFDGLGRGYKSQHALPMERRRSIPRLISQGTQPRSAIRTSPPLIPLTATPPTLMTRWTA